MDFADSEIVKKYLQFIGDTPDDELIDVALNNANVYVESCLEEAGISVVQEIPNTLKLAASYYAVHDIMSIAQMNTEQQADNDFLKKSKDLIDNYIKANSNYVIGVYTDFII